MKVRVKKDTCIGCGACTVIADSVFQIGDDGLAEVISPIDGTDKIQEVKEENMEDVTDAAEGCPTSAIEVTE